MKPAILSASILLALLTGCGQQELLKAKIFERRELKGNRLMIRYKYKVDDTVYTDSATVANVIIKNDSIQVIIDPSNPSRSVPDLTK